MRKEFSRWLREAVLVHGGCEQSGSFFTVAVTGREVLWTPTIRHASSATSHESYTCDWDQTDDLWQVPHYRARFPSDDQVPTEL